MKFQGFPLDRQLDMVDCGPACLKMVSKYYGKYYSLQYLRDLCGNTREGVSLAGIRQVLQHLDNQSILRIIRQFQNYKYIIATEHQLSDRYSRFIHPNVDKTTDSDIRLGFGSGVYLEKEPFNCQVLSLMYVMPESYCRLIASINTFLIKGHGQ